MTNICCRSVMQAEALRGYFGGLGVATGDLRWGVCQEVLLPVDTDPEDPRLRAVAGLNAHDELVARPYGDRPASARRPEYPHE